MKIQFLILALFFAVSLAAQDKKPEPTAPPSIEEQNAVRKLMLDAQVAVINLQQQELALKDSQYRAEAQRAKVSAWVDEWMKGRGIDKEKYTLNLETMQVTEKPKPADPKKTDEPAPQPRRRKGPF
jgi:hypothetical protein